MRVIDWMLIIFGVVVLALLIAYFISGSNNQNFECLDIKAQAFCDSINLSYSHSTLAVLVKDSQIICYNNITHDYRKYGNIDNKNYSYYYFLEKELNDCGYLT